MHHQNVSLQNAPSKRTLLTSLKRSKAGPPQLKRSKKYVLMVHFAVIRFDGASGACQETPTPTTCLKSTAVHLQFVRQYAPHLYGSTFLVSKLRREGNPAIRLPFVLQYAPHLYGSTPPICTAVLLEKYWGFLN